MVCYSMAVACAIKIPTWRIVAGVIPQSVLVHDLQLAFWSQLDRVNANGRVLLIVALLAIAAK